MGEYPEEYDENGKFEDAPDTWLSGIQGARAGSPHARETPRSATSSYRHGMAPKIGFEDLAKVFKTGQKNCVPTGCYDDVLVTDETNPAEPNDGHQLKYYAPDVGNIRAAPARAARSARCWSWSRPARSARPELAEARNTRAEAGQACIPLQAGKRVGQHPARQAHARRRRAVVHAREQV